MQPKTYQQYSNTKVSKTEEDPESDSSKDGGWCTRFGFWSPAQNLIAVAFFNETSIHGFKFLGQEKRHISERIFWLVGFCCSLALAIYLIYGVYDRYKKVPVIVSFQSNEQEMDTIPFPAVTFCNVNKFPKTKVEELQKTVASGTASDAQKRLAGKQLIFVKNTCNAQQSFAKDFHFAFNRGSNKRKKNNHHYPFRPVNANPPTGTDNETVLTESDQKDMTDFLLQNTIPCNQLIRLCMLGKEKIPCKRLFKPIITDYGKCCTFNIMPLPMLLKNPQHANRTNADIYDNPVLGSDAKRHWPLREIDKWKQWKFDDGHGFVLKRKDERPWRQKRSGLPYGLSVLLDPNTDDYYCPASDSMGMRYILHTPLETPHVMEFSSLAGLGKEILIEVHPDVINADDDIKSIDPVERLCLFGYEKTLRFFGPYTGGNCVDECTAKYLNKRCNCTLFYMPRDEGVKICDSDPTSTDHDCAEIAQMSLQSKLKDVCGECETLCEDIAYNYETTIADLQGYNQLWGDPDPTRQEKPNWMDHRMSVVHIFFGADSTVPKYRKRMYGITDLVANIGGILGLCLGFSILSGVEVVYFFTLRAFWKHCRKKKQKQAEKQQQKVNSWFLSNLLFQGKEKAKVINLNPNAIPVYTNQKAAQFSRMWGNGQGHHIYDHQSFKQD